MIVFWLRQVRLFRAGTSWADGLLVGDDERLFAHTGLLSLQDTKAWGGAAAAGTEPRASQAPRGALWFVPQVVPRPRPSVHQFEPLVLDEVGEILEVKSGQRQLAREAAGGDPGVVGGPRAAAELTVGLDLAPHGRDFRAVGENDDVCEEGAHPGHPLRSPVADQGPPGQLTHGDERDCEGSASELTVEGGGYSLAQDRRCDVGIEDDEAHATSDLREA